MEDNDENHSSSYLPVKALDVLSVTQPGTSLSGGPNPSSANPGLYLH
jgi:hypothetical protein